MKHFRTLATTSAILLAASAALGAAGPGFARQGTSAASTGAAAQNENVPAPQAVQSALAAKAVLNADVSGPVISRDIFGQFAEHIGSGIYGGLWVGLDSPIPNTRGLRNDVLAALRALKVPLVRWPGGCFADRYHWRDGIGSQKERKPRINARWGGIIEPNSFGTHEFMDFVSLIGAEAYINSNVGTATAGETADWVQYVTATTGSLAEERARNGHKAPWAVRFWGVGNELWGCGGRMRPEYAADLTRQFSEFIEVPQGTRPALVGSGPNIDDYRWTEVMMRDAGDRIDSLALHYYTIPNRPGAFGSGTDFDEATYARTLSKTLRMEELVTRHAAIMDRYDPEKRISLAVDEWGILTDVVAGHGKRSLFMQNSLRDAILASLNFNIFIRHADRVRMAAIAQMINVAQSMILTQGSDMVLTPTYHAFEMYKDFQDAVSLPLNIETPAYAKGEWTMPATSGVAARGRDGATHIALTNVDPARAVRINVQLKGIAPRQVRGRLLTAATGITAHNDFGSPGVVAPKAFDGAKIGDGILSVDLPPHSLVVLDLTP